MAERALEIACTGCDESLLRRIEEDLRSYPHASLHARAFDDLEQAARSLLDGAAHALVVRGAAPVGAPELVARARALLPDAPLVALLAGGVGELLASVRAGADDGLADDELGGGALAHGLHMAHERRRAVATGAAATASEAQPRALARFASVLVHDLQEPLRVIIEYGRLLGLRLAGSDDPSVERYLARLCDAARRMQDQLAALVDYARAGTRELVRAPLSCEDVLASALANLKVALEESGACVTHGPLPTLPADGIQLLVLFQNLIANAIRFRGKQAPAIHVEADLREPLWLLSVRDNGVGFDPAEAERIFESFHRLRSEVPGSGLGLAIARTIVERHGGRIWAESRPGEGSTFYFTLPR